MNKRFYLFLIFLFSQPMLFCSNVEKLILVGGIGLLYTSGLKQNDPNFNKNLWSDDPEETVLNSFQYNNYTRRTRKNIALTMKKNRIKNNLKLVNITQYFCAFLLVGGIGIKFLQT